MKHEESNEQKAFVKWADMAWLPGSPSDKIGDFLYAVPNGGRRDRIMAAILKGEGVRAGVPDLHFAYPWRGLPGLYIEMKAIKTGTTSENQKKWIARLRRVGYRVEVCHGFEAARKVILDYLGLPAEAAAHMHG